MDTVVSFDKPLLAAVNGVGVGLGCTLLGHVDLVLIDEGARLRVPFAELGVPPEAASSWLLPAADGMAAGLADAAGVGMDRCRTRRSRPGWRSGSARRARCSRRPWTLARRIASCAPHATREIKRLMMAAHRVGDRRRPGPGGGGLRRPVRRPRRNPGRS